MELVLNGWHLGMELKGRYFGFEICETSLQLLCLVTESFEGFLGHSC
jgi:hypothetical protein